MLIVSKFHDYYDTASIYGIDKTCVYLRSVQTLKFHFQRSGNIDYTIKLPNGSPLGLPRMPTKEESTTKLASYEFNKWLIGYCGKIYPVVRAWKYGPQDSGLSEESFLFSKDEVNAYILSEDIKGKKIGRRYYSSYWGDYSVESEHGMTNFFNVDNWKALLPIFVEFRVPAFVVGSDVEKDDKSVVTLNPCLKNFGFMRLKDPSSAFQDIYMYLSGVLVAPPKPTKPIDDKIMAASKGHDGEYSFKKTPGKKVKWR